MDLYRASISFSRLVDDCWGILQGKRSAVFPLGNRAAPSQVVFVFPRFDAGYYWELWEQVVVPTLTSLNLNTPPYVGSWDNPTSRAQVEAALSAALNASKWSENLVA